VYDFDFAKPTAKPFQNLTIDKILHKYMSREAGSLVG